MEDVDLYSDLPSIHLENSDYVEVEGEKISEDTAKLVEENKALREREKELLAKHSKLETNFSSLLITARGEIERKNRAIAELRKKLDNLTFRRNQHEQSRQENWSLYANEQDQETKLQNYPSLDSIGNQEYEVPNSVPLQLSHAALLENYTNSAENQEYNLLNNLYSENQNVNDISRGFTSYNVRIKQDINEESDDDEHIKKSQYRSTVYGERLQKRLIEEAENNRKLKEQVENEKKKIGAKNEIRKQEEIEKRKEIDNKEQPSEKTKEEMEKIKRLELDLHRIKKEETELNTSMKKEVEANAKAHFVNKITMEKNSKNLQSKDYDGKNRKYNSNYEKNMEYRNSTSYSSRNFDNKTEQSLAHPKHSEYRYNHFSNSEYNSRYNRSKNFQHEKSDHSRCSDHHKSRNREKSKSPPRRRGRSRHHKSRHRSRSNSADRNRDIRSRRFHYKERSISVDRVVVGLRNNKCYHKERSNSSEKNKENHSNSKSRSLNHKESSNFNRHKDSMSSDHGQLKDRHTSPTKFKFHKEDQEHDNFESKEKSNKSKDQSDNFRIPKFKRQLICNEKLPEKGTKRKIDTLNSIESKISNDSKKENLEISFEKKRKTDGNQEVIDHVKCEKEKIINKDNFKFTNCKHEKEEHRNSGENQNITNNLFDPCYLAKIIIENKFFSNELNDELEEGEIVGSPVSSPQSKSLDDTKLNNVISTEKYIENFTGNFIEKEIGLKQVNMVSESTGKNPQEITDNVRNKNRVTETIVNITDPVSSHLGFPQNDGKSNILQLFLTNNKDSKDKLIDNENRLNFQESVSKQKEMYINCKEQNMDKIKVDGKIKSYDKPSNIEKEDILPYIHVNHKSDNINLSDEQQTKNCKNTFTTSNQNIFKTIFPCKDLIKDSNIDDNMLCLNEIELISVPEKKKINIISSSKRADNYSKVNETTIKKVHRAVKDVKSQEKQPEHKIDFTEIKTEIIDKTFKKRLCIESQLKSNEHQDTNSEIKEKLSTKNEQLQEKLTVLEDHITNSTNVSKKNENDLLMKEHQTKSIGNYNNAKEKIVLKVYKIPKNSQTKIIEKISKEKKLQRKSSEFQISCTETKESTKKDNQSQIKQVELEGDSSDKFKVSKIKEELQKKIKNNSADVTEQIVLKVYKLPKLSQTNKITVVDNFIHKTESVSTVEKKLQAQVVIEEINKKDKQSETEQIEHKDTCIGLKEKIVEKVSKKEKVSSIKRDKLSDDCIKLNEKVKKMTKKRKNVELESKTTELKNALLKERIGNLFGKEDYEDTETLAKRLKLKDDLTKEKGTIKKNVSNKLENVESESQQIKFDYFETKRKITEKVSKKDKEIPLEQEGNCVNNKEKIVGKLSKNEKDLQAKQMKQKLDCTTVKENTAEIVFKKEKGAKIDINENKSIKPRMKPLINLERPKLQSVKMIKRPIMRVPVPKTAKNVIVVKRRRKPVQLSDSPPVVVVDETDNKTM